MERFFKSFRRTEVPVAPTVEPRRDAHLRLAREPRASSMPALLQPLWAPCSPCPLFVGFSPLERFLTSRWPPGAKMAPFDGFVARWAEPARRVAHFWGEKGKAVISACPLVFHRINEEPECPFVKPLRSFPLSNTRRISPTSPRR